MEIFQYYLDSFQALCTPLGIVYMIFGALAGVILGAIPGLGGGTLMVLLVPIAYKMNIVLVMELFIAIMVGSTSGGCIGSILLGIPGTQSSVCTVIDGYEMTKKGEPVRALSNAVIANFCGTIPSIVLAMVTCGVISAWAVKLGPWEYAALCFCAITTIIGLSEGSMARSFIGVGIAIIMVSVGADPLGAQPRFTFGNLSLYQGMNIINVMLGVFAAKMILLEYATRSKLDVSKKIKISKFKMPWADLKANWANMIRSWFTGAFIGFLPGLGGPAAAVIAYSNEKSLAKNKDEWGKGAPGSVLACETANNASIGGALIPMISLGIPGDAPTVQLLAVLTAAGINVGPLLITNNPEIVYMLFTAGIIAGIFVLLVETVGMPLFPAILKIPYHYLYPAVVVVCFLGSYMTTGNIFGLLVTVLCCLLGLFMDYFKIPVMPFMMAYILGEIFEEYLRKGFNYSDAGLAGFFTRPISCIFIVVGILVIAWHFLKPVLKKKKEAKDV